MDATGCKHGEQDHGPIQQNNNSTAKKSYPIQQSNHGQGKCKEQPYTEAAEQQLVVSGTSRPNASLFAMIL